MWLEMLRLFCADWDTVKGATNDKSQKVMGATGTILYQHLPRQTEDIKQNRDS
jgi:hypothetical protein